MNFIGKTGYNVVKLFTKLQLGLSFDFQIWGRENIPQDSPKIYCSNHFSSSDPVFVTTLMEEPIHMIIGAAFSVPFVNLFLHIGEQISAYGEARKQAVDTAVHYLEKGESVYIFPEGELGNQQQLRKFYKGLAYVYLKCPVPIVPIGLTSPQRNVKEKEVAVGAAFYHKLRVTSKNYYANIGKPMKFPQYEQMDDIREAAGHITDGVKEEVAFLIRDIKENKFWN